MAKTEHTHAADAALERAATICQQRGVRLTELRRQVLELVLNAERPAGAYDLLDQLRRLHPGAAPPTVYRALDFLLEHGLIHKLERLSAFIGCVHGSADHAHDHHHHHDHATQFLICRHCGATTELTDHGVMAAIARAAQATGFTVHGATVEIDGLCAACSAKAANSKPA